MAVSFPTSFAELDALAMPGAAFELDGKIVALNAAGTRLLARPLARILGRMAWDFAPGLEHLWAERIAAARVSGGRTFEIAIATAEGARTVEYAIAVCELDGRPYVIALVTDVRPLG